MPDEQPLENFINIGPTKCDDYRSSRQNEIDKVWEIIKPSIEELAKNPKIQLLSNTVKPTDLFREALSCYQNGAFAATCALCRSSIESLLYVLVAREITTPNSANIKWDYIHKKRNDFLVDVLDDCLLDKEDIRILKKIWNEGDFVMHMIQKIDKSYLDSSRWLETQYWIDKDKALDILSSTASIISKILTRLSKT